MVMRMTDDREKRMHELPYSNEGRVEQCERICKLEQLVDDSLAVILGWAWKLNEIGGHDKYDPDTLPMETFSKLLSRAKELGVPDA